MNPSQADKMIASEPTLKNALLPLPQLYRQQARVPKGNVLLAGQNKQDLDVLGTCLQGSYDLLIARSASGAMKLIETHSVNLLIVNAALTDADGNQLCRRLKSSSHYSHIPVILTVEKDAVLARIKSLESGADACLEKPFNLQLAVAQIDNIISNRARIKDHFADTLFAHMHINGDSKPNEIFIKRLNDYIAQHLGDECFDVDGLSKLMNMSRPTLYRKVKCISDMTPNELINIARLKKAAELLLVSDYRVADITKIVGFNSRSNFGKAFFKHFSLTPTAYQQMKRNFRKAV